MNICAASGASGNGGGAMAVAAQPKWSHCNNAARKRAVGVAAVRPKPLFFLSFSPAHRRYGTVYSGTFAHFTPISLNGRRRESHTAALMLPPLPPPPTGLPPLPPLPPSCPHCVCVARDESDRAVHAFLFFWTWKERSISLV